MILNAEQIVERGLIYHPSRLLYPEQIQQIGIDLTVKRVRKINGGTIRADNNPKEQKVRIEPYVDFKPFTEEDGREYYILSHLTAYSVLFEEECIIPSNATGFIKHRSSFMRCGGFANSAIFDPGFKSCGGVACTIYTFETIKLEVGARLVQMYFEENTPVDPQNLYNGQYQGIKDIT